MTWPYAVGEHPLLLGIYNFLWDFFTPALYLFLSAVTALLLGSPFLLRGLRDQALRGWVLGMLAVVASICLVFIR
jgi:hypothetical protein